MNTQKPIWASKMFWANGLALLAGLLAMAGFDFLNVDAQGEIVVVIMGIVNLVLRWFTVEGVTLTGSGSG